MGPKATCKHAAAGVRLKHLPIRTQKQTIRLRSSVTTDTYRFPCVFDVVSFVLQGYTRLLNVLGSNLAEFLQNLNDLHLHLQYCWPDMLAPAFRCEQVRQRGLYFRSVISRNAAGSSHSKPLSFCTAVGFIMAATAAGKSGVCCQCGCLFGAGRGRACVVQNVREGPSLACA